MVYCSTCGTQNRDGSKFCNNCGSRLSAAIEQSVPPQATPSAQMPAAPNPIEPEDPATATRPEGNQESMDLPEWLRRLRMAVEADHDAESAEGSQAASEPTPPAKTSTEEWLSLLRENPPQVEDGPATPPQQSGETPDWILKLSRMAPEDEGPALAQMADEELRAWEQAPQVESSAVTPQAPVEENPPFFGELDSTTIAEAEQTSAEQEFHPTRQAERDDLPGWLREISEPAQQVEEAAPRRPIPAEPVDAESLFDNQWIPGAEQATDEEIPAWVKRLSPQGPAEQERVETPISEEQPQVPGATPEPPAESPLLRKPILLPEDVGGDESIDASVIPDWLRLATASEQTQEEEPSEPATPEIEPARPDEVPSWVEALKPPSIAGPAESVHVAAAESNPVMEGLPGVLPLAVAITEPHFTGDRPAKVEASKGGRLFESILGETPATAETISPARFRRQLTLRPLIYVALALAVLVPILLPNEMAGYAIARSDNASNFYNILHSVPANGTVVISFDYEPSLAGEMDLQANAVVRDLVSQNVRIVAVSILPTGPQVAQRVLDNALSRSPNYAYGTGYINYGYIAGQEAGLLQFATNGVTPGTKDYALRQPLDKFPLMASFRKLNDAHLIIEFAGSEQPLTVWMEQARPRVPVQIIAGVSAAVEPRAQTYLNAKQLSAYAAGLMDAARLEVLRKDTGMAVASANALTWAMAVLVVVIVIGNLVYWGSRLRGKAV